MTELHLVQTLNMHTNTLMSDFDKRLHALLIRRCDQPECKVKEKGGSFHLFQFLVGLTAQRSGDSESRGVGHVSL